MEETDLRQIDDFVLGIGCEIEEDLRLHAGKISEMMADDSDSRYLRARVSESTIKPGALELWPFTCAPPF